MSSKRETMKKSDAMEIDTNSETEMSLQDKIDSGFFEDMFSVLVEESFKSVGDSSLPVINSSLPATRDSSSMPVGDSFLPVTRHSSSTIYEVGAVIMNHNLNCYMNVVLQCLTHIASLHAIIHSCRPRCLPFCLKCDLRRHFDASLASRRLPIDPKSFVDNLNYFGPDFTRDAQEDAHEFLITVLTDLFKKGVNIFQGCNTNKSTCLCCRSGKCRNCTGTTTEEIQTINHLSLEIAGTSLFDCLSSYTNEEATKGTCSYCNCKHIDIKRRTLLTLIPEVIVFHLMRFQNNGKIVTKIHSDVDCLHEIDLSAYTSGSTTSSMYELYAVIQHIGNTVQVGHYVCFIRPGSDHKKWYKMDDEQVTRVAVENDAWKKQGYIIFYKKKDTPDFASVLKDNHDDGPSSCRVEIDPMELNRDDGPSCYEDIDNSMDMSGPFVPFRDFVDSDSLEEPDDSW